MSRRLSELRRRLDTKLAQLEQLLAAAFEGEPVFPGSVSVSRHRCGKPQCRCQDGELHEAIRLQIRFKDAIANRCLSEEEAEFWRPRTEAYRRIREATRSFRRWQKEILELLDSLERQRRSSKGLRGEDRKRPLR